MDYRLENPLDLSHNTERTNGEWRGRGERETVRLRLEGEGESADGFNKLQRRARWVRQLIVPHIFHFVYNYERAIFREISKNIKSVCKHDLHHCGRMCEPACDVVCCTAACLPE